LNLAGIPATIIMKTLLPVNRNICMIVATLPAGGMQRIQVRLAIRHPVSSGLEVFEAQLV